MTKKEFETLSGIELDDEQYGCIETIYMMSAEDKQYFCALMKVMNKADHCTIEFMLQLGRTLQAGFKNRQNSEKQDMALHAEASELLIGKSRAYNDPDFRGMACKLIGEKEVIRKTMEMDMPLWDEDKSYINSLLNR